MRTFNPSVLALGITALLGCYGCGQKAAVDQRTTRTGALASESIESPTIDQGEFPVPVPSMSSNMTPSGYCIVSVYVDADKSIPVLCRLSGNTIHPVEGAEIGGVRLPMAEDHVADIGDGLILFLGNQNHGHNIVHYNKATKVVNAISKEGTSPINEWPRTHVQGSDRPGLAFVPGDETVFIVSEVENAINLYDGSLRIRIYDRGVREAIASGVPYGAWHVSHETGDALLLHVGRENGAVLVLVHPNDANGKRLEQVRQVPVNIAAGGLSKGEP